LKTKRIETKGGGGIGIKTDKYGMRRITKFRSTTYHIYDGGPIRVEYYIIFLWDHTLYYIILYYIILYYIILYYIILLTVMLKLSTIFSTVTCCTDCSLGAIGYTI